MKENNRAARDLKVHRRLVAWAQRNGEAEKVEKLKAVRSRRIPAAVAATEEREILADILEGSEKSTKSRRKKPDEEAGE